MKYNKLVRDNIPEIIINNGGEPVIHVATDKEYWQKLKEKLLEEVLEFQEAENMEEFADILEVLEAITDYKKFDNSKIIEIKKTKTNKRGAFKKMIILDES